MKHRNNKGFTLIELLAVVVILGIIAVVSIVSVSKLISRSKTNQLEQQKKMVLIAAKSYAQDNRIVLPKSIGDVEIVHLNDLKKGGYLKQDVKNANDKDCMVESLVKITKTSATKYNYEVFLYCGDEKAPSENEKIKPKITISFIDDEGNPADKTEVAVARFKINIKGSASRDIAIDSYSYIIMTDTGKKNSLEEAYNSGTLSGNNLYEIEVDKKLKDYIDITRATQVTIKVVARNVEGGLLDETTTLGKPEKGITYNDNVPPKCVSGKTLNEADEEEWINKKDFLSEGKTRTITVFCEDGKGSGCVRDSFVRTWPNKTIKSARYGYIQVSDNAGNKHLKAASEKASNVCDASLYDKSDACVVRVNVDVVAPIIEVGAYRNSKKTINSDVNSITGSNMLKSSAPTTTKDTEEDTATIKVDQYKNLHNDWMNFENYENGVIYKVTLKDDLHLIDWKWETNVDELDNIEDPKYEELSVDNVDGHVLEKIPDTNSSINCGVTEKVIYVGFTKNGKRKGKLTVTDIAGNVSTFVIEANLDRLVPQTPEVTYFYAKNNKNYDKLNEWWKEKVKTHVKSVGEIGVSGYDRFEYLYYNDSKTKVKEENKDKCKKEEMDCFVFSNEGNDEGKNYIKYRTCDVADNCSEYSNDDFAKSVWMDTKPPTDMYVKGYKKVSTAEATRPTSYGEAPSNTWIGGYYDHNEVAGNKIKGIVVIADGAKDPHAGVDYYVVGQTRLIDHNTTPKVNYYNINNEGTTYVYFKVCDKIQNCSDEIEYIGKLDTTKPTGLSVTGYKKISTSSASSNPGYGIAPNGDFTGGYVNGTYFNGGTKVQGAVVVASGVRDNLSGGIYYLRSTSNSIKANSTNKYSTINYDSDGNYQIYFRACDQAYNCTDVQGYNIILDKTAPSSPSVTKSCGSSSVICTTSACGSNGPWCTSDSIKFTASGGNENSGTYKIGCASNHYYYSLSGSSSVTNSSSYSTSMEGTDTIKFSSCDKLGNCSSTSSYTIKRDSRPPTCTASYDQSYSSPSIDGITGTITCNDPGTGSGCKSGSLGTRKYGTIKSNTTYTVEDNAGNRGSCTAIVATRTVYRERKACSCKWENSGTCTYRTSSDTNCAGYGDKTATSRCSGNGEKSETADGEWSCGGYQQYYNCYQASNCGWDPSSGYRVSPSCSGSYCESRTAYY